MGEIPPFYLQIIPTIDNASPQIQRKKHENREKQSIRNFAIISSKVNSTRLETSCLPWRDHIMTSPRVRALKTAWIWRNVTWKRRKTLMPMDTKKGKRHRWVVFYAHSWRGALRGVFFRKWWWKVLISLPSVINGRKTLLGCSFCLPLCFAQES